MVPVSCGVCGCVSDSLVTQRDYVCHTMYHALSFKESVSSTRPSVPGRVCICDVVSCVNFVQWRCGLYCLYYSLKYKSKLPYEQRQCVEAFERRDHDTALILLPLIQEHSRIECRHSYYNSTICLVHCAAGWGWADITKQLATIYKCDVTQKDRWGRTALHHAAMEGHVNVVQYLVSEHGCSISDRDNDERAPLHLAAKYGHLKVVQYLVSEHGCSVSDRDDDGRTPLHHAAKYGHLKVVEYLASEYGCDKDNGGCTPLHLAAKYGHLKVVEYLASEYGCDKDNGGCTPLHLAAREGHLNVVEYLVSVGDDVMTTNRYGYTPLHHACQYNVDNRNIPVIKYLLSIPVVLNSFTNGSNHKFSLFHARGDAVAMYDKFERIHISHPVGSFVNIFLLGDTGAGKTTLSCSQGEILPSHRDWRVC